MNDRYPPLLHPWRQFLISLSLPWVISTAGMCAVFVACRMGAEGGLESSGLGFFIGGCIVVNLVAPAVISAQSRMRDQAAALVGTLLPWVVCWAWITLKTQTYASEWAGACLILASFAAALSGACAMLIALELPRAIAAAAVTLLGLLWIAWPIWTTAAWMRAQAISPVQAIWQLNKPLIVIAAIAWIAGFAAAARFRPRPTIGVLAIVGMILWLIGPLLVVSSSRLEQATPPYATHLALNPALAINAQVYRQFGSWIEQSVAYHLTELNQSMPYAFPESSLETIGWHAIAGAFGFLVAAVFRLREKRSQLPRELASPIR